MGENESEEIWGNGNHSSWTIGFLSCLPTPPCRITASSKLLSLSLRQQNPLHSIALQQPTRARSAQKPAPTASFYTFETLARILLSLPWQQNAVLSTHPADSSDGNGVAALKIADLGSGQVREHEVEELQE